MPANKPLEPASPAAALAAHGQRRWAHENGVPDVKARKAVAGGIDSARLPAVGIEA